MLPGLAGFFLLVGILAGSYPAFYLSAFDPSAVITGAKHRGGAGTGLRNGLVVFQFAISIVLMVSTAIVYSQMDYMRNKKLGFQKEQVVILEGTEVLGRRVNTFKQKLLDYPHVLNAAFCESVPGRTIETSTFRLEGGPEDDLMVMARTYAGFDFAETLGLESIAGRTLSAAFAGDSTAVLINETAARRLGVDNPIGKKLIRQTNNLTYTIVGVLKDYHFESLHREIMPAGIFGPDPYYNNRPRQLFAVRIQARNIPDTLVELEQVWNAFVPEQPFTYAFMDVHFEALYRSEQAIGRLLGSFSVLAVLIACLGLLGLAAYTTERRTKEIGIRKVLGASISSIVFLLSREYVKLIILANLVAWPVAYYAMDLWLQDFAYKIDLGPGLFILSGLLALIIAFVTVGYQAVKAGQRDPVKALRYE